MKTIKFWLAGVVLLMAVALAHTGSPSLTTFSNGQVLTASALNDNFGHIHNTLSGGIANAHVSSSAAIQYSKLNLGGALTYADFAAATKAYLPRAWAMVDNVSGCDSAATGTCTLNASTAVTSVTTDSTTGQFKINLAYTPTDIWFSAIVTPANSLYQCATLNPAVSAPHLLVTCKDNAGAAVGTMAFTVVVFDNN